VIHKAIINPSTSKAREKRLENTNTIKTLVRIKVCTVYKQQKLGEKKAFQSCALRIYSFGDINKRNQTKYLIQTTITTK